jgi:hypothetical protein
MNYFLRSAAAVCAAILLILGIAAGSEKPTVRVKVLTGVAPALSIEAEDSEGLDSLDVACPEVDTSYHTQLSRAAVDRRFKRTFSLSELFPTLPAGKGQLRLTVTIRNTGGLTESAQVLVSTTQTSKGK